jgi:SARP family transcriptional regulator, regulator of embCAB operon
MGSFTVIFAAEVVGYVVGTLQRARTRVQLCGRLVVELAGRHVEDCLPGRQGRLLFAYLAINRPRRAGHDELIEVLWPEGTPAQAEAALRSVGSRLRSVIGSEMLKGRGAFGLELPVDTWIDIEAADAAVHQAESAVQRAQWQEAWAPSHIALNISRRPLLAGLDAPWLDEHRRHLAEIRLRALETWASAGLGIGGPELSDAEAAAKKLIGLSPLRESAYVLLMQILQARGNPAEAIRIYERLRACLGEELGVLPGPTARSVYQQILMTS